MIPWGWQMALQDATAVIVVEVTQKIFGGYISLIEKVVSAFLGRRVSLDVFSDSQSLDERIAKIEEARNNLFEALQAVDDLRRTADENKQELKEALEKLTQMESQKASLSTELAEIQKIKNADVGAFRDLIGIPTAKDKWWERFIGFVSGIVASIIASALWIFGTNIVKYFLG